MNSNPYEPPPIQDFQYDPPPMLPAKQNASTSPDAFAVGAIAAGVSGVCASLIGLVAPLLLSSLFLFVCVVCGALAWVLSFFSIAKSARVVGFSLAAASVAGFALLWLVTSARSAAITRDVESIMSSF